MAQFFTFTAITENSPGVLHRITGLFTRRKINIESLSVSETEKKGISRFTIVVETEKDLADIVVKQMRRVIEVVDAYVCRNSHLVFREVALIKVATDSSEKRSEIEDLTNRYNASISYGDNERLIVEVTGTDQEISALNLLLEPYGVEEFIRSGRVALLKGKRVAGERYLDN